MEIFGGQNGQLGSILEAQDLPKSRLKPQKIDVKKQYVFGIDFSRVQTSFCKDFGEGFRSPILEKCENLIFKKSLKIVLPSRRNAYFQGFETLNLKDGFENAFKNHVFFGISIWKGFGEGFGRVLGHQNP